MAPQFTATFLKRISAGLFVAALCLGCAEGVDPRTVTMTDPETGDSKTFDCDQLIRSSWSEIRPGLAEFRKPTLDSSDLRFILPNLDAINAEALQLGGITSARYFDSSLDSMRRGNLNSVAVYALMFECRHPHFFSP